MLVVGCALLAPAAVSQAQNNNNQGRRGNFDPAQMRERMMNNIKERLGPTDDEWKVLEPKIEKVMTAQREGRGGFGFGGFGGGGGRRGGGGGAAGGAGAGGGGGADQQPTTAVGIASQDLNKALESKDTPAEDIAKKLAALRDAREKAKANTAAAQKELKEVLTARQEAVLVTMGMLE
jgi:hypothetical protein